MQIIRRVRKADEPHGSARLHSFDKMFRAQNHRCCAVGDLRTIADFERRRDEQVDVARGAALIKMRARRRGSGRAGSAARVRDFSPE